MGVRQVLRSRLGGTTGREAGFSLIELVVVMTILVTILGGLTSVFLSGMRHEADLNSRVQAQIQAGVALDKLRREVHCANVITPSGAASSITLTFESQCAGGAGQVSWCAVGSGSRYGLYRKTGATCNSTGVLVADYLISSAVFNYTAPVPAVSLGVLAVDLPVNVRPSTTDTLYELKDNIALRNTTRT